MKVIIVAYINFRIKKVMNCSLQDMTISICFTKTMPIGLGTTSIYIKGKIMYNTYIINNLPTIEWASIMSSVVLCS